MSGRELEKLNQHIIFLLEGICQKYISDSTMVPLILSGNKERLERVKMIDGLYQSVLTSLQFGQYRRAVWYLQAFSLLCSQTFGESDIKDMVDLFGKIF